MEVSLRTTCEGQEEFLFRLYASTRQEELAVLPWDETQKNAFLKMQFQAQKHTYASAYNEAEHQFIFVDDEPVGRILVKCDVQRIHLVDIALLPQYRKRGIGSGLIRKWILRSEELGIPFSLQVTQQNSGAFRLYQKLGFLLTSEDAMYRRMERQPGNNSGTRLGKIHVR